MPNVAVENAPQPIIRHARSKSGGEATMARYRLYDPPAEQHDRCVLWRPEAAIRAAWQQAAAASNFDSKKYWDPDFQRMRIAGTRFSLAVADFH